jgi:hypothetical protein
MRRLRQAAAAVPVIAALAAVVLAAAPVPASTAASTPRPLPDCFGHPGVQVGSFDDYACIAPGGLYFWVTLDNGVGGVLGDGVNAEWYKQHPDPGNFWVFETFTPGGSLRANGRTVIIDVAPFGECQVVFPSWSVTPAQCTDLTQGGQPGETHQMTPQEQASVNDFIGNMRAAIPLEYR